MTSKFKYVLIHDANNETIGYIPANDIIEAWIYLSKIKRLDIGSLKQIYNIVYNNPQHNEKPDK